MKFLEFDENTKLSDILKSIQDETETAIEIKIAPGNSLLQNKVNKELILLAAERFGKKLSFREKNHVVTHEKSEATLPTPIPESAPVEQSIENHGFLEGKDVAEEPVKEAEQKPPQEDSTNLPEENPPTPPGKRIKLKMPGFNPFRGPKWIYFVLGILLLLVGSGVAAFYLLPHAQVDLYTKGQFKEAEVNLASSNTVEAVDEEKGLIPQQTLENTQEDSGEFKATGKKTIGTAAKGSITIYNCTLQTKPFFVGTTVTVASGTSAGKKFKIIGPGEKVEVPPRSGIGGCTGPGQKVADVEALSIGADYNVAANNTFSIGSAVIDDVYGTNSSVFTGGSSKQVTVISADDQKKAKEDLTKKMEEKARQELEDDNPDFVIPNDALESKVVNEDYDKAVGVEAENFKLSLKMQFSTSAFSEADLKKILVKKVSEDIPSGYKIDEEGSEVQSEILSKEKDGLRLLGEIRASLVPSVNEDDIKRNIAGKNFATSRNYLESLESVTKAEIKVTPFLFRIFGIMPTSANNITVKIINE
jgi:hypothetical protein